MESPRIEPLDEHQPPPDSTTVAPRTPTAPALVAPVASGQRIHSIDVLRGVALLGILCMNIYAFGLPWPAYTNPLLGGGDSALARGTWWFTHLLAEMKFMTIFSALFGAGLALMAERAAARGGRFGRIYYRRIGWLLVFGLIHGYLMWFGDILYWYAVCGLILYPLRRLAPRTLIAIGLALLLAIIPLLASFGFFVLPMLEREVEEALAARAAGETLTERQEDAIEGWQDFHPTQETVDEEIRAFRGGYLQQVVHRAPLVFQFQTVFMLFFGFWRIGGLMVLGMALLKLGVFSAQRSYFFYALCCLLGYGVGLPLVAFGAGQLLEHDFDPLFVNQLGYLPNYFGSLLVAAGHVGVVMLVCRAGAFRALTARIAAVGRMALTNYLMHTVICTTFFYGWGLGWFGYLDRFQMMVTLVPAIWILQLIVSPLWLRRFRYGPAEWLWRGLTYGTRPPMRV